jgi:hypothetical protein
MWPMRVTVSGVNAPGYVVVDLHWSDTGRLSRGYLLKVARERLAGQGGSWSLSAPIGRRAELRYVTVVVYLSPTGEWKDHERVAQTGFVEVSADAGAMPRPVRLRAYERTPAGPDHATALGRAALAALLAALSAAAATRAARSPRRALWIALAAAALAAAAWEIAGAGGAATQAARAVAEEQRWYDLRRAPQHAVVAALLGSGVVFALIAPRAARSLGRGLSLALLGFVLYALLSAVDLLSYHAVDRVGRLAAGPVSAMQLVKASCAALALAAALLHRRRA